MKHNGLKHIDGKKIRRQYFNSPLIILYSLMIAIPYFIFIISLCAGEFDSAQWPSTLWISIEVCFCFSLPFLILRTLNEHFFGRIISVLTKEGIHYPKGMLRWKTIERIEYAIDSKPRCKSDCAKGFRAIVYTRGGKHVILNSSPLYLLSCAKKYSKELNVKISGATSLIPGILIMAAIIVLCPFYLVLLRNSPGASLAHFIVMCIICGVLWIIRPHIFDAYSIQYRFWRRILPKKWLSYIILGCYYSSFFAALLVLCYFPNWVVASLLGIYLGVVQAPIPSRYGNRLHLHSYEQLYEIYINKADFWEGQLIKNKESRIMNKRKK